MPTSYNNGKQAILDWIKANIKPCELILDIGPGEGTYADLLHPMGYKNICAVEVFKPYIEQFGLNAKYKAVHNGNVCDLPSRYFDPFSLIIMGDVLEHMDWAEAHKLLFMLITHTKVRGIVVAVPFLYAQGEVNGNFYEIHRQPDLTPEVMTQRYPYLKLLTSDGVIGVYTYLKEKS